MAVHQEFAVAAGHLQHVVDLVRDAASNVADGLHLLAVREALLQQPVLFRLAWLATTAGSVGVSLPLETGMNCKLMRSSEL